MIHAERIVKGLWWFARYGLWNTWLLWRHRGMRLWDAIKIEWLIAPMDCIEDYQTGRTWW